MGDPVGFERFTASLIVVAGGCEGDEHRLERPRWLLGRGPDVDAAFDDVEMAPQHAVIEFVAGGFRVSDLAGGSSTEVNGREVSARALRHGDRIRVGGHVFQILIERRDTTPVYASCDV